MRIEKRKENLHKPSPYSPAKVTTMGNVTEIMAMQKTAYGSPCRKINKDLYFDTRTGDVHEYQHIENRAGSLDSIRRTLANIRGTINSNVTEPDNCRWVILTYAQNMTDTKQLYKDTQNFWDRLCYWCKKNGYEQPEYINVIEPQGRGAWHAHLFVIWQSKAPFIPNDTMAKLWGHGFTKTKAVTDCDNVGAYFSAYLADIPLDEIQDLPFADQLAARSATGKIETKEFEDDDGTIKSKKFVKGGRLFMYPVGMKILRCSKGIVKPIVESMTYEQAQKKVSGATETFTCTYDVVGDDGELKNSICKEYYNSKRKG